MKVNYFPDTDTLYIDLSDSPSTESESHGDAVVVDYDEKGQPVGITIEGYSDTVSSKDIEIDVPIDAPFKALIAS